MRKFPSLDENFIVPSILSANIANLKKEIKSVEKYSGWIQVDVMDGHFVPNLSFGPHLVKCLRNITNLPIDVHLMVEKPLDFVKPFFDVGADIITVHFESQKFEDAINMIKKLNIKAGLAIKPKTPFKKIKKYIKYIDLILIMTVEPGFGGQNFMYDMLEKIKQARDFLSINGFKKYIQVDGGINIETVHYALNSGANSFVMGSAIFNEKNPYFIKKVYNILKNAK